MYKVYDNPPLYFLDNYDFPDQNENYENGFAGASRDLDPQRLLNGYSKGFFPWYQAEDGMFHWYLPSYRMILKTDEVKKTKNLRKKLRSDNWDFSINQHFKEVITNCATITRPHHMGGNWISKEFIKYYTQLHELGFGISVESYYKGELVGGFYGVGIGKYFSGESMFAQKSDASKLALLYFCDLCVENGIEWIDCQTGTEHLERMGAKKITKTTFLEMLDKAIKGKK